jgi:thymidylate kinase
MKRETVELVERAVAGALPVLTLRGADPQARSLGDLDFLVPKGAAVRACRVLADAARERGWFLLSFRDIGYLATVVLTRPAADGGVESVKVDFFSGLEWYGAGGESVSGRFFRELLPAAVSDEARRSLAGAVNFLQKCMTTGRLAPRDLERARNAGASAERVLAVATQLGLPLGRAEAESGSLSTGAKWRLRGASGGARTRPQLARWILGAAWAHLRFRSGLGTHAGLLLAVGGLDGSGKSTQLDRLARAFGAAGVGPPLLVHLLPSWIPMPHQLFRRRATAQAYHRPYSEAPVKSTLSATVRLAYYLVAFFVARVALRASILRGRVVIMDRSFMDFVADLARAKIPHRRLPDLLLKGAAPVGCLVFLDADPAVVVDRKGELTLEKARDLQQRYRDTVRRLGATAIDGNGSSDAVYGQLLGCVERWHRAHLERVS